MGNLAWVLEAWKAPLVHRLCEGIFALAMGVTVFAWVASNAGPRQGTMILHVMTPEVQVSVGGRVFHAGQISYDPLICELSPGDHELTMSRDGRVLDVRSFSVSAGQEVVLTVWDRHAYALARYKGGQWDAALQELSEFMRRPGGGDSYDRFLLAMVRWRKGDRAAARADLQEALAGLSRAHPRGEELDRLRDEATSLLGVTSGDAPGPHRVASGKERPGAPGLRPAGVFSRRTPRTRLVGGWREARWPGPDR